MHRTQLFRFDFRVLAPAMAVVFAIAAPSPALNAQERFTVLVPAFVPEPGARGNFGKDVAKEFNKLLEDFGSHQPIDSKELRDALRKYSVKEEELGIQDCLKGRQLALQINLPLVLCGTFAGSDDNYTIHATVISPQVNEAYEMEPITAANPKEGAQKLSVGFQKFLEDLKVAVYCEQYVSSQSWQDALDNCTRAVQANPKNKNANLLLGAVHYNMGNYEQAKGAYRNVLEIEPLHEDAMFRLGVVYSRQDSTEKAMEYFRQYLELNPGDIQIRMTIAADAATAGGPEASLAVVEEGMPSVTGEELLQLQEYAGAYAMNAALKNLAENNNQVDENSRPYLEKGALYLEKVHQAKGAETDINTLRNLLTAYRLLERYDDALALGPAATQAHPDDAALWSTWADVLNSAKRTDEALAALDKTEQIDPKYPLIHSRRIQWLIAAEDIQGAVQAVQRGQQAGEIDAQAADIVAQQIAYAGYTKFTSGDRQTATAMYDAAEPLASSESTKGMIAFFRGFAIYQRAVEIEKAETLESARTALPMFERVASLMRTAAAWDNPQVQQTRTTILSGTDTYIERQRLIIKQKGGRSGGGE